MVNQRWNYVMASIETEWPELLGGAYDTLNLFTAGKGIGEEAADFLAEMFHPRELLKDSKKRNILISILPLEDAEGLVRSLGKLIDNDESKSYYVRLRNLKYTSKVEDKFLEYFGIEKIQPPEPKVIVGEEFIDPVSNGYPLRGYQRQVLRDVNRIFSLNKRVSRCMVQMPTGSGKTRTLMYYISELLNSSEESMVLWLAYSKELCDQASDEFSKAWMIRGNKGAHIYRYYGNSDCEFPTEKINGIVVTTLSKLNSAKNKNPTILTMVADNIDLVVFDEAHQIIAPTYEDIVTDIVSIGSSKLIGLSATPGRTWNDPEEDRKLSGFFHNNIARIETGTEETPNQMLTRMGYLSRIKWVSCDCNTPLLSNKEKKMITDMRDEDEIPSQIIEKLSTDAIRNAKIISAIQDLLNDGKKRILVFSTSVAHSKILCGILKIFVKKYGCEANSIDGNTEVGRREEIIRRFKSDIDVPQILCNYGVLTTGFDAPNVDAGIIARPTKSLVLFSQMVGRMIRGPNTVGGTEEATIVSVVDLDLPGFKDSYDNWQDVWL